ncbi:MAG: hypothetical protein ACJ74W_15145 [Pyrinomonadaceae bacterium]
MDKKTTPFILHPSSFILCFMCALGCRIGAVKRIPIKRVNDRVASVGFEVHERRARFWF